MCQASHIFDNLADLQSNDTPADLNEQEYKEFDKIGELAKAADDATRETAFVSNKFGRKEHVICLQWMS